jgi:hypothetical protein
LAILLFLSIFVCILKRSDFINLAGIAAISFYTFMESKEKKEKLLHYFIRANLGMIVYDILWVFINFKVNFFSNSRIIVVQNMMEV